MIKNYDFPIIFRSVVGDVLPFNITERHSNLQHHKVELDFMKVQKDSRAPSSMDKSIGKVMLKNIPGVQCKKKMLQRRAKIAKTSGGEEWDKKTVQSGSKQQTYNSPVFVNFLKRKKSFGSQQVKTESLQVKNINSSKRKLYKIRTSLVSNQKKNDNNSFKNIFDKFKSKDQINSQSDKTNKGNDNGSDLDYRQTDFCQHQGRDNQRVQKQVEFQFPEDQQNDDVTNYKMRSFKKKKTVNFMLNEQNLEGLNKKKKQTRRLTKLRTSIMQNQTKDFQKRQYTQQQNVQSDVLQPIESKWTARSMISIKFTSKQNMKKKRNFPLEGSFVFDDSIWSSKRLRTKSQQSIMNFKRHLRTKTKFSYKKSNSLKKLSQISIQKYVDKQKKKQKLQGSKKIRNYNRKIRQGAKKTIKRINVNCQRYNLGKQNQPFLDYESFKNVEMNIIPLTNNLCDLSCMKNTKQIYKTLKNDYKGNVFQQLNKFNKFMRDNSVEQTQEASRKSFSKQMIIQNQRTNKKLCINPLNFSKDNMMIDMGLTLIKRMNQLVQKKL